jgi:TPR repeat protein
MKFVIVAFFALLAVLQTPAAIAKELNEYRAEADQYYQDGDFKKARSGYLKLAKIGDHYSQYWISKMYANGEGKKANLPEAYGWSVLAAESGKEELIRNSEEILVLNTDQDKAQSKARKLMKKYGKEALDAKAEMIAKRDQGRRAGSCVGSRLTCSRGAAFAAPMSNGDITNPAAAQTGER